MTSTVGTSCASFVEARFGVGHGQMDEEVLEEIVLGFVRKDFDVLISTTIIESGVDIPDKPSSCRP